MTFLDIAKSRQSCRNYDGERPVEKKKLVSVIEAVRLSPSACNAQPYHLTVCSGECAREIARHTQGMGMNKFATDAPVVIVISEAPYNATAKLGSKVKHNDYRSIDIGIAVAHLTLAAEAEGLSTCILGWFDNDKIRERLSLSGDVRLVVTLGYKNESDVQRDKKRKSTDELVSFVGE